MWPAVIPPRCSRTWRNRLLRPASTSSSAAIATWPDGAVLDTFIVRATARPSARDLALAMEDGLRGRLEPHEVHDVTLEFVNDSMPWNTVCIVSGPDQPGALYAVSAAFAAADVVVHTARVSSFARKDQRPILGVRSRRPEAGRQGHGPGSRCPRGQSIAPPPRLSPTSRLTPTLMSRRRFRARRRSPIDSQHATRSRCGVAPGRSRGLGGER